MVAPNISSNVSTEIDHLLSKDKNNRYFPWPYSHPCEKRNFRKIVVTGAVFLSLFAAIYLEWPAKHKYREVKVKTYVPDIQLRKLNDMTRTALHELFVTQEMNRKNGTVFAHSTPDSVYQCITQVMIMRHCDKEVDTNIHGKIRTHDKRDFFGDGHCNAEGKERADYIATLFVSSNETESSTNRNGAVFDSLDTEGVLTEPHNNDDIRPQFPTPLKLFALNDARYNSDPTKEHKNFREVETITPLAKKFNLDIDQRFGINEEGDLAIDFFTSLSNSVKLNVGRVMNANSSSDEEDSLRNDQVCQNGMTVINWKHSLIPHLAQALGCGIDEGCPKTYHSNDYDTVWVLTFRYSIPLARVGYVKSSAVQVNTLPYPPSKWKHHETKEDRWTYGSESWSISARTVKEGFDQDNEK